MNNDAKLFKSNTLDEGDVSHSPGRLGYRSIPHGSQRQSNKEELASDSGLPDRLRNNSDLDVFQRENSATSLHSSDSSESLEGKKNQGNQVENSPSITSSGYHSDEIHHTESLPVIGDNTPPRCSVDSALPASPSMPSNSVHAYDATRYQDETSSPTPLPSVSKTSPLFAPTFTQLLVKLVLIAIHE